LGRPGRHRDRRRVRACRRGVDGGRSPVTDGGSDATVAAEGRTRPTYWLTRFVILRLLGFVYFAAYLSLATQVLPLIGAHGLLPAEQFLARVGARLGSTTGAMLVVPSV